MHKPVHTAVARCVILIVISEANLELVLDHLRFLDGLHPAELGLTATLGPISLELSGLARSAPDPLPGEARPLAERDGRAWLAALKAEFPTVVYRYVYSEWRYDGAASNERIHQPAAVWKGRKGIEAIVEYTARRIRTGDTVRLRLRVADRRPLADGVRGLVTFAAETFTEIGLAAKAASPATRTLFASVADGCVSYLATAEAHAEGGYEVDVAPWAYRYPARLAPEGAQLALDVTASAIAA